MPELPEVETTSRGLQKVLPGLSIMALWSDYPTSIYNTKGHIKSPSYFKMFQKALIGKKFLTTGRRGKNVLLHLSDNTSVLIHMKMTGHILYGKYEKKGKVWKATEKGPLQDPYNQFIHLVFSLSNGKHLCLSDVRKFAKVLVYKTQDIHTHPDTKHLGLDALDSTITPKSLRGFLMKKQNWKIKSALLNQELIAGIGNIYSDEILFETGIHPETQVQKIPEKMFVDILKATRKILIKSIGMGGDSESDYRNAFGEKGQFQNLHKVYRKTGKTCIKPGCKGIIKRVIVGGRSAHFCPVHQKKW